MCECEPVVIRIIYSRQAIPVEKHADLGLIDRDPISDPYPYMHGVGTCMNGLREDVAWSVGVCILCRSRSGVPRDKNL
ncbi:uncharacterized protein H6S33_000033 [Morchella sextelata]|uniref:uncharacterized protein n=1 Tax=Morchella sextelata TaxID=1174677 RepID=UPI001D03DDA5|nr:uncharacterized protein H6S33_000033 [Morchella sextelata]KAH0614397.1 hypothetical protein H6S33_000033 [Morchella sextelata]